MLSESLGGISGLLVSEDMEVQERAHNAHALLADILRVISPGHAALPEPQPLADLQIIDHPQRYYHHLVNETHYHCH